LGAAGAIVLTTCIALRAAELPKPANRPASVAPAGWRAQAKAIFAKVKRDADQLPAGDARDQIYRKLAEDYALLADAAGVDAMLSQIPDSALKGDLTSPNAEIYSRLGSSQIRGQDFVGAKGSFQKAVAAAQRYQNERARDSFYGLAVQSLVQCRDFETAQKTAQSIGDAQTRREAFVRLAEAEAKGGDIKGAEVLINAARACPLNNRAGYDDAGRLVHAMAAAGEYSQAIEEAGQGSNPLMRDLSYAMIISMEIDNGDLAGAKKLACGISQPSMSIYTHLAHAEFAAGDRKSAAEDLAKADQATAQAIKTVFGIKFLQQLIAEQMKEADYAGAAKLLESLPPGVSLPMMTTVTESGDISGAKAVAGYLSDPRHKDQLYIAIFWTQADRGDHDGAQATADLVSDPKWKANLPQYWKQADRNLRVVQENKSGGGFDVAAEDEQARLDENLKSAHPMDPFTEASQRIEIGHSLAGAGKQDEAIRAFSAARDAANRVGGPNREQCLQNVAIAQASINDSDGAIKTVDAMSRPNMQSTTLAIMAVNRTIAGDHERGRQFVQMALDAFQKIDQPDLKRWPATQIMRALANLGDVDAAKQMLLDFDPGREQHMAAVDLAGDLMRAGYPEDAVTVIQNVDQDPNRACRDTLDVTERWVRITGNGQF
jgi:hypothetical protein